MTGLDGIKHGRWRDPYNDEENADYDYATMIDFTGDPGLTLQAPAEEQDINVIMRRFGVTDGSRLPYWHDPNALYGDFTDVPTDPVEAAEYLRLGELAFMQLPATIRQNFQSGAHLYNWMQDPNNTEKAIELGLMTRSVSPNTSSDKEPLVNPPTPVPEANKNATP